MKFGRTRGLNKYFEDLNIYTPGDISYNTMWSDAVLLVYSHADATSLKIATCFNDQIERAAISMRIRPPIIWLVGELTRQEICSNMRLKYAVMPGRC